MTDTTLQPNSCPSLVEDLPLSLCPKCQELLSPPRMKDISQFGPALAYDCPLCGAFYVFTPITTFHLIETPARHTPLVKNSSPLLGSDQEKIRDLRYALNAQIPDMIHGFTITTTYGEFAIDAEFSESFRNIAADVLQYQLNKLTLL